MAVWKQERPKWCPHRGCIFKRRSQDSLCGGDLPQPINHNGDKNNHRLCLKFEPKDGEVEGEVIDIQLNDSDLGYIRWIFDALDGKKTSWLSKAQSQTRMPSAL